MPPRKCDSCDKTAVAERDGEHMCNERHDWWIRGERIAADFGFKMEDREREGEPRCR